MAPEWTLVNPERPTWYWLGGKGVRAVVSLKDDQDTYDWCFYAHRYDQDGGYVCLNRFGTERDPESAKQRVHQIASEEVA